MAMLSNVSLLPIPDLALFDTDKLSLSPPSDPPSSLAGYLVRLSTFPTRLCNVRSVGLIPRSCMLQHCVPPFPAVFTCWCTAPSCLHPPMHPPALFAFHRHCTSLSQYDGPMSALPTMHGVCQNFWLDGVWLGYVKLRNGASASPLPRVLPSPFGGTVVF
eukprot:GGOE01061720.1.p2 GENE.GGOE01061720.1~~GGOE01061720.1.p2  ORF type:complete len:160 (+),score=10.94 GGOE01061720.1:112-591(+)